jgi:tetratricopeptide (TPR) repeat protein
MQIKWGELPSCSRRIGQTMAAACLLAGSLLSCVASRSNASGAEQPFGGQEPAPRLSGTSPDAAPLLLLARSKQDRGEYVAARAILIKALLKEPRCPALLDALGSVEQDLAEYGKAEQSYLRALHASAEMADNAERIVALHNLGTLYLDTGNYARGQRIREQLEELRLDPVAADHPKQAALLLNLLASLNHERNRDDEAEHYYARALQLLRQTPAAASGDIALIENNLGFLHLEAKQYDSAANFFLKSITDLEASLSADNAALIRPLINLARCENSLENFKEAESHARRAVQISSSVFGQQHPLAARAMLEQSFALRRLGYKARARELERPAKITLKRSLEGNWNRHSIDLAELKSSTSDTAKGLDK